MSSILAMWWPLTQVPYWLQICCCCCFWGAEWCQEEQTFACWEGIKSNSVYCALITSIFREGAVSQNICRTNSPGTCRLVRLLSPENCASHNYSLLFAITRWNNGDKNIFKTDYLFNPNKYIKKLFYHVVLIWWQTCFLQEISHQIKTLNRVLV